MCYIQNKNRQHTAERHLVRNLGSGAEGFVFIIQSKHLTLCLSKSQILIKWLFWPDSNLGFPGFDWFLPNSGIWREVMGIVSDTLSWNTVSERSTVTPKSKRKTCGYSCLLARDEAFYREFARVGFAAGPLVVKQANLHHRWLQGARCTDIICRK